MLSNKFFGFLTAFFFICLSGYGSGSDSQDRFLQITSGEYRFRLQVISQNSKKEVQNATATVSISKSSASIEIHVPGYRKGNREFKLIEGKFYYEGVAYVREPDCRFFLRDQNLQHIYGGVVYPEWEPCNNCWYDEICIGGEFPKGDHASISIDDFHVHINHTHDYAYAPRVFIFEREDKWGFEIIVDRTALKAEETNYIDIIIAGNAAQNRPEYLIHLAEAYGVGLENLGTATDESDFLRRQERLESTATVLTRNFAGLDPDTQSEIIGLLPADGPLTRNLKSIASFAALHQ
jgi:hypothetical protein